MMPSSLALVCRGAARTCAVVGRGLEDLAVALDAADVGRARRLAESLRRVIPLTVEALRIVEENLP